MLCDANSKEMFVAVTRTFAFISYIHTCYTFSFFFILVPWNLCTSCTWVVVDLHTPYMLAESCFVCVIRRNTTATMTTVRAQRIARHFQTPSQTRRFMNKYCAHIFRLVHWRMHNNHPQTHTHTHAHKKPTQEHFDTSSFSSMESRPWQRFVELERGARSALPFMRVSYVSPANMSSSIDNAMERDVAKKIHNTHIHI